MSRQTMAAVRQDGGGLQSGESSSSDKQLLGIRKMQIKTTEIPLDGQDNAKK